MVNLTVLEKLWQARSQTAEAATAADLATATRLMAEIADDGWVNSFDIAAPGLFVRS